MRSHPPSLAIWSGIVALYVIWGTTYLGIAFAIQTIPPFVMIAVRFALAGVLLMGIVAVRDGGLRRPTPRELRDSLVVGTGLVAIGNAFVGWGEQTVPTGVAALLIALMPAWVAALGRILYGDRLPRLAVVGIVTGLAGIVLLSWPTDGRLALEPYGLGALLLAPIGWSLGSLYSAKNARLPSPPLLATAYQMIGGALVGLVFAGVTGELATFSPAAVSDQSLLAMAYLTLVGSLIGYTTYGWLIRVAPLSRVTTYAYVNPIVAVALGAIVLHESITPRTLAASIVIIVAVALIVTARSRGVAVRRPDELEPATRLPPASERTGAGTRTVNRDRLPAGPTV